MPTTTDFQRRMLVAIEAIDTAFTALDLNDGTDAFSVTYYFTASDFGAGNFTEDIESPVGVRGRALCISLWDVTETFNTDTTEGRMDVGIQGGDVNAYGISQDFGALASAAGGTFPFELGVVGTIPASDNILLTGVAPTGGTPTGIASWGVTIQYFV